MIDIQTHTNKNNESAVDPELGAVDLRENGFLKFLTAFFQPVLIPTYCMAISMWLTPLSLISEDTRLGTTMVIFSITALAPLMYLSAVSRISRHSEVRRRPRAMASVVFMVCQLVCAYYLGSLHAPEWLFMILGGGAMTALAYFLLQLKMNVSRHAAGMGAMTGAMFYLAQNSILVGPSTLWIIGLILLSGLVGSACRAVTSETNRSIAIGYVTGWAVTYGVMCVHIFKTFSTVK